MYKSPKLVRFGSFRDLTRQDAACPNNQKINPFYDVALFNGGTDDGCPARS